MEIKRAGDLMIPLDEYPHIPYWFTLRQAIAEMENAELEIGEKKSLPRVVLVFDEKYQLMGTARRRDILRGLEPEYLLGKPLETRKEMFNVRVDPNLAEFSYDKLLKGIRKQAERPISDVMQPIATSVDYNDHIIRVIYEIVDKNLAVVPVVKGDKVVGVIRTVNLMSEVANILL